MKSGRKEGNRGEEGSKKGEEEGREEGGQEGAGWAAGVSSLQYRGKPADGRQVTANQLLLNASCTIIPVCLFFFGVDRK